MPNTLWSIKTREEAQLFCRWASTTDVDIADRAIQVGVAREGQSFVFESITSELW